MISLFLSLFLAQAQVHAQTNTQAQPTNWYKDAAFYEVYIRSFKDSNHDGIGDINGITSKLDYLKDLGVDAVWITPCFPSPQVDFGYDVSDYKNIDPQFGTLKDFDHLIEEAKKRNIKIILDFVLNHTSDQHEWFKKSQTSPEYRDFYIWHQGQKPPNNWISIFGGSAWEYISSMDQSYYHRFYKEQPDLNWRNPKVKEAMFEITEWWYKRGVSGFRLDAVDTLFEDPELRDEPVLKGKNKFGDPNLKEQYTTKLPEVHDVLKGLRKIADQHDAVLVGETWTNDINELKKYYGENEDELQMPMDLLFTSVNKLSAKEFHKQITDIDSAKGWPVFLISNHDIVRSSDRYGDGKNNVAIAKLMAALYLSLRGTPILYYGEEIGMLTTEPRHKSEVKDPIGITGWPKEKGRDGSRTPMQWGSDGFSDTKPWLPIPPAAKTTNVDFESKNPDSIFSVYKKLLHLRKNYPALRKGKYTSMSSTSVLQFIRQDNDQKILVVLNMSKKMHRLGMKYKNALLEIGVKKSASQVQLEPYGVFIAEMD